MQTIKLKNTILAAAGLVVLALAYCGLEVHRLSARQESIKSDYCTLNNVSLGLLSVSQWRDKLEKVISGRIRDFSLTDAQRDSLEKEINVLLNSLLDTTVHRIEQHQKSLKGKLSKFAFNLFVNVREIHQQVPAVSRQIIARVETPSSKRRLEEITESKIEQFGEETYDSSRNQRDSAIQGLLNRYGAKDAAAFNEQTRSLIHQVTRRTYLFAAEMLVCILLLVLFWVLANDAPRVQRTLFVFMIAAAAILLLVGLSTAMIEVDARIKSLDLYLLGTSISFHDQVLFFQSKSILDVVAVLFRTGRYDSVIVGILILAFSILFPVAKLVGSLIVWSRRNAGKTSRMVRFFAFESGKWSMADVMVVAILMTYMAFNGILDSQLADLNIHNDSLVSITTNRTSLQPGYIVFVAFVLFGLLLSHLLKKALPAAPAPAASS